MSHVKKELKQKTVVLGILGLQEQFSIPGCDTNYKTIDYPPSFVNPTQGSRSCLNMGTLKAEILLCRSSVIRKNS